MHDIGIVGAGTAGLHLALLLQKHGIHPTLYAEASPDEMRKARLPSTVALFGTARGHMKELGVAHWDSPDTSTRAFDFDVEGVPNVSFRVPFPRPPQFIDMRLYLPRLLEDFARRGGRVVTTGPLTAAAVADLGAEHDLVVVASGRGALAEMFPRRPERCPYTTPKRHILAGLFAGIRFPDEHTFTQRLVPGGGEICEFQLLTHDGPVSALLMLTVPGGPLESITRHPHEGSHAAAFNRALIELLTQHAPDIARRIDPSAFRALGDADVNRVSITPTVRHGVHELRPGRYALALGDAHITMDPITAQGANAAAKAAWLLGGFLRARVEEKGAFDGAFCRDAEQRLWELLEPFVEWNNATLGEPKPHVFELIAAAARDQTIAAEFTANFDDPKRQWEILSSAEKTRAFITR